MSDCKPVTVYFGGDARELWTGDGLKIAYSGRIPVDAVRDERGVWRAAEPYAFSHRVAPALTLAYFTAAADAAEALYLCGGSAEQFSGLVSRDLTGGADSLILAEALRILLDELALSWDAALSLCGKSFALSVAGGSRVPLTEVQALQPRCASLIRAVDSHLREKLLVRFRGDAPRAARSAVLSGGEVYFTRFCSALCGSVSCSADLRAGELRGLYTLMPERFT